MNKIFKDYIYTDFKNMRPSGFLGAMNKANIKAIKRVNQLSGFKKVTNCDYCKKKKFRTILIKNNMKLVQCINCDLIFSSLLPINIDDVYSKEEYLYQTLKSYEKNSNFRKKRFGKERMEILSNFKKTGSLLDLGCGIGWFLDLAKKNTK